MATIPLATLLDFLVQKSYHDLTVMAELLPRKSDIDRKIEIVQYAKRTRLLFIRLLALVKWASTAESLKKCAMVSEGVDKQAQLFVDTADQLAVLARDTLTQACLPNFGLASAIDVLSTGFYPRLPTCIRTRTVPPGPLSNEENIKICGVLEDIIRKRLIAQPLPSGVPHQISIMKGRAVVVVPNEFKVVLTLLGDDPTLPWRLLDLEILTRRLVSGEPPLVHTLQKEGLHQLVQSRLFAPLSPLVDMYNTLHTFCLSLWLDVLHSQCLQYARDISGGHTHIEEYNPGVSLKICYWKPLITPQSIFLMHHSEGTVYPKLTVSLSSSGDSPSSLILDHNPPLPVEIMSEIKIEKIGPSFQNLLNSCIQANVKSKVESLLLSLRGTPFESKATRFGPPHGLRVELDVGSQNCMVSIDSRVGTVLLTIEPHCRQVISTLEEIERDVTLNGSKLPESLQKLRLTLCHWHICNVADNQGLTHSSQLPMVTPPAGIPPHSVYIKHSLIDGVYMVVAPVHKSDRWTLDYRYFYMWMTEASSVSVSMGTMTSLPSLLQSIHHLVEVDIRNFILTKLGRVPLSSRGVLLKRNLCQNDISLPSSKRICFDQLSLSHTLLLSDRELFVLSAQQQLHRAGLDNVVIRHEGAQGQILRVLKFPPVKLSTATAQSVLEKKFKSCVLYPSPTGWECTLCLNQDILPRGAGSLVVCNQSISSQDNIGGTLMRLWVSMVTLLDPVLEFTAHLEGAKCEISDFTYRELVLSYGPSHEWTVTLQGLQEEIGVVISEENPHHIMQPHLQSLLNRSKSIALLIQGLNFTLDSVKTVQELNNACKKKQQSFLSFTSRGVSNVTLTAFGVYNLDMWLQKDGSVMVTDGGLKQPDGASSAFNPGVYIQGFFKHYLSLVDSEDPQPMETSVGVDIPADPNPKYSAVLAPSPRPIPSTCVQPISSPHPSSTASPRPPTASPRPPTASPRSTSNVGWDSSNIPNLPSVPSPRTPRTYSMSDSVDIPVGWSFCLTHEQFTELLTLDKTGESPLTRCLGCLSLFHQFRTLSQLDKQVQIRHQSRDHGWATVQMESLKATLHLDQKTYLSVHLSLHPVQDFTWTPQELECLVKFFQSEVMCPPYAKNNLTAYFRLLSVPFNILRSCVHILLMQMSPPPDVHWHVKICLTIPEGQWVQDITVPGQAAIAFKGKLLLFVLLQSVTMMGSEVVVPLLYDPNSNITKVAHTNPSRTSRETILKNIDKVLKGALQDYQQGGSHFNECSLFTGVKAVISHRLYDSF